MMSGELSYLPVRPPGRLGYNQRLQEAFRSHLEKSGLHMTRQRRVILDHLLKARKHLELEAIYQALRRRGVGRATVFRTLKLLEECGLANHVTSQGGACRYEIKLERPHHDHLICIECGSIQEVRWPELERIQETTCRQMGFVPTWHRHEIFGRCGRCPPKRRPVARG